MGIWFEIIMILLLILIIFGLHRIYITLDDIKFFIRTNQK